MNDVKFLCETLLDEPAPPLRDAADVLAVVHRAKSRRTATLSAVGAFAAVAAVGAAVLAVPRGPVPQAAGAPVIRSAPSSGPSPTPIPPARAVQTHDRQLFAFLSNALPPGYTARTQYPFSTNSTPYPTSPDQPLPAGVQGVYTIMVSMIVSDGSGEGQLWSLMINDHKPALTGDLCGAEAAARVKDLTGTPCRQVTVAGVPIRLSTETDDAGRDVIVATRFLDGGYLDLIAGQSVQSYDGSDSDLPPDAVNRHPSHLATHPGLAAPYFTPDQVAALAADPTMLS